MIILTKKCRKEIRDIAHDFREKIYLMKTNVFIILTTSMTLHSTYYYIFMFDETLRVVLSKFYRSFLFLS